MKTLADVLGVSTSVAPGTHIDPSTTPPSDLKLTVKNFCRGVLNSAEYRMSIARRILSDTLPPAVETKMYEYAYGKPVDKVEIKDTTERLEDLSSEELEARAMTLAAAAKRLRREAADDDAPAAPGVH